MMPCLVEEPDGASGKNYSRRTKRKEISRGMSRQSEVIPEKKTQLIAWWIHTHIQIHPHTKRN